MELVPLLLMLLMGSQPILAARLLNPRVGLMSGGSNTTGLNGPIPSSYNNSSPNYGYGYNNTVPRPPRANCRFTDHGLFDVSPSPISLLSGDFRPHSLTSLSTCKTSHLFAVPK